MLWVATAAALVVLFIFARENYLEAPVNGINLIPNSDSGFVRRNELRDEIGGFCSHKTIGTVNMVAIQRFLDGNPWIESNTSYIDLDGNATSDILFNPNGSMMAIEGITSPDGRVFGKMGHAERVGSGLYKNVPGEYFMHMFESGIKYFK